MKIFVLLIIAFIIGTFFKGTSKSVLSAQVSVSPTSIVEPTVTSEPIASPKPTGVGGTLKPTSGTSSISINNNVHVVNNGTGDSGKVQISVQGADWQYPGSADDSAATVTDWFVNKIKSMGMSTTSFVKTNANDHVLNCLAAGNGIKIQISQNSDANCQW